MDILSLEIEPKYKKWLKTVYDGGDLHPSLAYMCQKHSKMINVIPIDFRDIYFFKNVNDFISYVDTLESETDIENNIKNNDSRLIYEDENYRVRRIYTKEAMTIYGKGSKWCISADSLNMWDKYEIRGDVFFIVFSKKISYNSQFNKFIVQMCSNRELHIWDRSDINYNGNVLDLISLEKGIFTKHIDDILITDLNSFIDKRILGIFYETKAIVAGGALTSLVRGEKINDIDIWFSKKDDYEEAIRLIDVYFREVRRKNYNYDADVFGDNVLGSNVLGSNSKRESKNAITFNINDQKYQFINPDKYEMGNVDKIINQFDFNCVMCGIDYKEQRVSYSTRFYTESKNGKITINPTLRSPANLLNRIIKYSNKGFRISTNEQKIALTYLSKISDEEIENTSLY
jgi:hypothetical protein